MAQLQGGRLFARPGRGNPPVRGNTTPSYAVDQKYDQKLQGATTMRKRLAELKSDATKFANSPREMKAKVAPYAQQLLGMAFNQRTAKEFRLEALTIVTKLGRKYAQPAEQDLPQLAKDKDADIAKAASAAIKEFKKQKAPLGNFRFNRNRR